MSELDLREWIESCAMLGDRVRLCWILENVKPEVALLEIEDRARRALVGAA